jgi:surfactin synthase thioesterase subunit
MQQHEGIQATATNAWIRCRHPNPHAHLRLFCFPYAGGGASIFRTWADELSSEVEVCSIQLPGRENRLRETPFNDLSLLVQVLITVLRPYLNQPFALFGHSMGALISYELTRQLRNTQQLTPTHLFVSGHNAPQRPDLDPPLHHLPTPAFLEGVRSRYNAIPEAVWHDAELMALLLAPLRADFTLLERYNYTEDKPLDCPISTFGGQQDSSVRDEDLEAWRDLTRSTFRLRLFPGGHFYLNDNVKPLLQAISQELIKATPEKHASLSAY